MWDPYPPRWLDWAASDPVGVHICIRAVIVIRLAGLSNVECPDLERVMAEETGVVDDTSALFHMSYQRRHGPIPLEPWLDYSVQPAATGLGLPSPECSDSED